MNAESLLAYMRQHGAVEPADIVRMVGDADKARGIISGLSHRGLIRREVRSKSTRVSRAWILVAGAEGRRT